RHTRFSRDWSSDVCSSDLGVFVVVWGGKLLAAFAHERLREKPPSGGVSIFRRSVAPDPVLLERSLSLLRRFDWQGVAMVEFKRRAEERRVGYGDWSSVVQA